MYENEECELCELELVKFVCPNCGKLLCPDCAKCVTDEPTCPNCETEMEHI